MRDSKLGKVAISKEDLILGKARDETWYPIQPIQADTEVQVRHASLSIVAVIATISLVGMKGSEVFYQLSAGHSSCIYIIMRVVHALQQLG